MSSVDVTNNHLAKLNVAGVEIEPNKTARIDNWQVHSKSRALRIWIDNGVITVKEVAGDVALPGLPGLPTGLPGLDPEAVEKQKIIDELRETYGIEKTLRSGLDSLRSALASAKAAAKK